jgi:hypothetical protein
MTRAAKRLDLLARDTQGRHRLLGDTSMALGARYSHVPGASVS